MNQRQALIAALQIAQAIISKEMYSPTGVTEQFCKENTDYEKIKKQLEGIEVYLSGRLINLRYREKKR